MEATQTTVPEDDVAQLKRELHELSEAIAAATRDGDIRRNAQLTLQSCRIKQQLTEAQARRMLG